MLICLLLPLDQQSSKQFLKIVQRLQKSIQKTKKKAKATYNSQLLRKYKTHSKRTWQVMKEITGKQKIK